MTGAEMRRIRQRLGWTQAQLAEKIGLHVNTIARQERGELAIREVVARLILSVASDASKRR